MSYADEVFKSMCKDIIDNGISNKDEKVRTIWADTNKPAYTIKKFGVVNRYDLQKEFPILTLRRTALKSATDEILWIYQKKSNNIHDLNSHIWDSWADSEGSIGKAYGYQIGQPYIHHKSTDLNFTLPDKKEYPSITDKTQFEFDGKGFSTVHYISMDQIDSVIWDLRNNPFSRRIMTNTYNFQDLNEMNLYPCAYSVTFNVTKNKDGKLVLNAILNQRSQDVLAANNWNVVQYAVLVHIIAQCCDMIPGELVHVIADCHIYDRHIPLIKELIGRFSYPAPKFRINPNKKNFYDFTVDDIHLENYQFGPQINNIPIAV